MTEAKTHQQKQIDNILSGNEAPNDHSLSEKSWQRAKQQKQPITMSPDEWELWNQMQGKTNNEPTLSWFGRLLKLFSNRKKKTKSPSVKPNCSRSMMEDSEF